MLPCCRGALELDLYCCSRPSNVLSNTRLNPTPDEQRWPPETMLAGVRRGLA